MNKRRDAVYQLSALPRFAPWLFRYWQNSTPERVKRSAQALAPLMAKCVDEHDALIAEAGPSAQNVVHHRGWLNCFRTEESLDQAIADAQRLDDYGVDYVVLSAAQLRALEPHVSERVIGAIHFRGSPSASDPGMLTKAYADLFTRKGGRFIRGDARSLASGPSGWSVTTEMMSIEAREAVVALGPWSDDVFRPLGYNIPLAVKRGYHMHYGVRGNATLSRPIRDADGGFSLAPMSKGIRLTTGVEFADRDAPASPVQLARDEPLARELFPLAEHLEPEPWMGRRPCLPDMVPVIGKGERHHGLWFAFGHAHHGFTLGPVVTRMPNSAQSSLQRCRRPTTPLTRLTRRARRQSLPTGHLFFSPHNMIKPSFAAMCGRTTQLRARFAVFARRTLVAAMVSDADPVSFSWTSLCLLHALRSVFLAPDRVSERPSDRLRALVSAPRAA
jgi:D-amino-acid dehydrogenase